jgi:glutamate carboxypeptidase
MKGGLTQLIFALEALCRLDLKPQVTPIVFISSDGKIGSGESTPYIRRLARTANRALVLTPSLGFEGYLKTSRRGVGCFTMTVRHNELPTGLNKRIGKSGAMVELSKHIQRLLALNDPAEGVTVNIRMIDSGLRPNVVKPVSRAVIDVRVPTHAAAEHLEADIRALSPLHPGVQVRVTGAITRPPMERTPQNEALWNLAYTMGLELGLELREAIADGGSDGNTASQYTATLDGLGAVGESVPGHPEFVFPPKLIERAALLAMLILTPPLDK